VSIFFIITLQPQLKIRLQGQSVCAQYHNLNWGSCQNQTKVMLWLQKHYIHSEFKPNDAFLSILYMFILWDTKGGRT
jgi:hypothetical protein